MPGIGIMDFPNLSLQATGFQSLTVGASAVAFDATQSSGAVYARYTVDTADVRVRLDGTNPAAASGELHESGTGVVYELYGPHTIVNAKFIRATGTSGKVNVHFFSTVLES